MLFLPLLEGRRHPGRRRHRYRQWIRLRKRLWLGQRGSDTTVKAPPAQIAIPAIDNAVTAFMNDYNVPGLSIAVTKDDKLVYMRSYGKMSAADTTPIANTSLFRIASCSKQFTSVGIMKLLEAGTLTLDTKVFGAGSIFGSDYPSTQLPALSDITIGELLHHTTGNWPNDATDPMFLNLSYTQTQLINWALDDYAATGQRGQYLYSTACWAGSSKRSAARRIRSL